MKKSIFQVKKRHDEQDRQDVNLLQQVATKDRLAFEALYSRYYPRLSRYLSRLMRRPEMVEEVVNDTLFVVWNNAEQFAGRSKVSTWITGIAYFKGIKMLDRIKMMPEQNADAFDAAPTEELATVQQTQMDLMHRLGLADWLSHGLDQLPLEQRSVVELTYFSGYSYQEIAEVMQCPLNTVKTRMFHARRRLAKLLPALQEHKGGEHQSAAYAHKQTGMDNTDADGNAKQFPS